MSANSSDFDALRERFAAFGQSHVFRFWDRLDPAARARLAAQAAALDLELLAATFERSRGAPARPHLQPAPIERLPEHGGDSERRAEARKIGEDLLAAGRVGVVVVAGGQGTRLGFEGPKGAFPIGPLSDRPLFELQAQKLRRLRRRYGTETPWYVMTSPATDGATRELFQARGFFGLPREDVFFFCQGTAPSLDFAGRLLLAAPDRIAESPNGHGGFYAALVDSGAVADMGQRGIDRLSYYQVDNPLALLADPLLLGLQERAGAEMAGKVVRKRHPAEKMGVVALIEGRPGIVEYTEIDEPSREARDANGELVYWAGSIAMHAFRRSFVERVAREADRRLPYHLSAKKIPTVDESGAPVQPSKPNGYKLERFVFDGLPVADGVVVMEVRREEEYSPVKNAEGEDSPETARRGLMTLYRRWLAAAGVQVPPQAGIEIDHSRIDGADDARESGIRDWSAPIEGVRVAPGVV